MKAILYALVTGVVGIVLLLGFFSLFTAPEGMPMLVPPAVGFNALVGGWNLGLRTPKQQPLPGVPLLVAVLFTMCGTALLWFFCPWLADPSGFKPLLGTALVSFLCGWAGLRIGVWIARRSRELNQSNEDRR